MNSLKIKWYNLFLFRGANKFLILLGLGLSVSAFLGNQTPRIISNVGDSLGDREIFYTHLSHLTVLFLLIYLNRVIYQVVVSFYMKDLIAHVRLLCYRKWLLAREQIVEGAGPKKEYPLGEVLSRIMSDTEALRELITSGTLGLFIDIVFVLSLFVSFIKLNTFSGPLILCVELLASFLLLYGSSYMREVFLIVRKSQASMSRTVASLIGGMRQVFFEQHSENARKKSSIVFEDFFKKQIHSNIWDASYYSFAESLYPILLAFLAIVLPKSGIVEAGIVFALVDLVQRSIGPLKDISGKIANIQRAYSGIIRIEEFTNDLNPFQRGISKRKTGEKFNIERFSLSLDGFEYLSQSRRSFSLKSIRIEAQKGELVGIVGKSGCGKSTLLKIIGAQILAKKAKIDIRSSSSSEGFSPDLKRDADLEMYQDLIGPVSQDSHVFNESLAFNISFSHTISKELESFWSSCQEKISYLKRWGIELKDVVDSKELSAGQIQLIAAFRVCYLKRPIVLFDEVSASLDGRLEMALSKMILKIQKQGITFIVAHRPETLIRSNQLLVMDEGKIVDRGTHASLKKSSGLYQDILSKM